ncbi:hypothetical protein [Hazenella coriacea]|uniref:Uncharacterized protein n=1 Tax=Hazenella coriacea TaxID=1179467 RepID=A0A4R3LDU1_9BACL|nr:hypothetical protein [Hazenella coriacea]TCS96484.1 hypothetical protein EDD58_101117 [Hazenella coriacea]
MKAQLIQEKINRLHYWDARLLQLHADYFGDEVTLLFEDSNANVKLLFSGCSKVHLTTNVSDRIKPMRELSIPQIPYFIQDLEITDYIEGDLELLNCKISAPPLMIELRCYKIEIVRE